MNKFIILTQVIEQGRSEQIRINISYIVSYKKHQTEKYITFVNLVSGEIIVNETETEIDIKIENA